MCHNAIDLQLLLKESHARAGSFGPAAQKEFALARPWPLAIFETIRDVARKVARKDLTHV